MAVVVPIVSEWNPKGVDRAMADIKKAEGKLGKTKAALGKAFLPAVGALAGLGAAAWDASKAAEELASSQAKLSQVFSQMGNEGATQRVQALADELERTLGVDEKLIMQVQTTLGTFGELAASADEAGGAFDRASMAALDLAAAGFGTAEGNAVQLGKALNDPIKGLASLAKSGVTFTEAEKDMIKAMVEAGDMMGAQNMVLEAIEKQVGGTALATADSSAKMGLAFADLKETVGMALLPVFDAMNDKLAGFAKWASENSQLILILGGVIGGLAAAIVAANIAIKVWTIATQAYTAAQWLLNAALNANPIGLVVIGITALIAIVVLAYNKVDWFRDLVDTAWAAIQVAIEVVVEWFQDTAWPILKKVFGFIAKAVETYVGIWIAVFGAVWDAMRVVFDWLVDTFGPTVQVTWDALQAGIEALGAIWGTIWEAIGNAVQAAWDFMKPIIDRITSAIDAVKAAWDGIGNIIGGAGDFIGGIFGRSGGTLPVALNVPTRTGGGTTVNVNVNAGIGDPIAIARQVQNVLRTANLRTGMA